MTDRILIEGACTHSLEGQIQESRTHTAHPWHLWLVNRSPASSAISIIIISQSMDLAGLAHGENSLTLHCFLTKNTYQSI